MADANNEFPILSTVSVNCAGPGLSINTPTYLTSETRIPGATWAEVVGGDEQGASIAEFIELGFGERGDFSSC